MHPYYMLLFDILNIRIKQQYKMQQRHPRRNQSKRQKSTDLKLSEQAQKLLTLQTKNKTAECADNSHHSNVEMIKYGPNSIQNNKLTYNLRHYRNPGQPWHQNEGDKISMTHQSQHYTAHTQQPELGYYSQPQPDNNMGSETTKQNRLQGKSKQKQKQVRKRPAKTRNNQHMKFHMGAVLRLKQYERDQKVKIKLNKLCLEIQIKDQLVKIDEIDERYRKQILDQFQAIFYDQIIKR